MILVIVGPTGVGKTKMSIELAKRYDAEIISCDSMQIYKNMDIATAKVTKEQMNGIKHHMISIKDVTEDYSVYDYQKDARKVLDELLKKNKNVVIVGGTGLYLKALLYDYKFKKNEVKKDFTSFSNDELYNLVKQIDENTSIHKNNRQRLESYLNNHDKKQVINKNELLYNNVKIIGLTRPRNELYDAINKRVDKMLCDGLLLEAKGFYDKKINSKLLINEAARSYEEQAKLYQKYLQGGTLAAKPGTSQHEKGLALDISQNNKKFEEWVKIANKYGLYQNIKSEAWHFELMPEYKKQADKFDVKSL